MNAHPTWRLKLLFDGQCPFCSREVAMMKVRNERGHLAFEDITAPAFNPAQYGVTIEQLVGAMHAVRPDGSLIVGVDVFAEMYEAVGWRWLARPMRWRLTRPLTLFIYRLFARIRPRLSGFRPDTQCSGGTCKLH
jgi:predicted DCC family thiol-disulfide oxidoreductase YuxK